jgi:biopolymer transport protein TolR
MILPSQRAHRRRAPMAEINVTPMVDVMLVLLIIFMVTAPLLVAGVPVNLPDARSKALDQDAKPVQLSLDATGKIFLNDLEVAPEALPDELTRVAARGTGDQGPQVFLRADRALDYGRVMRVMGELSRAGLTRVALVAVEGSGEDAAR